MAQTREAMTQHLAERRCWQVARREDARVARRLERTQVVDGGYQRDAGALVDDFGYCLHARGVVDWLSAVQGTAVPRAMVPVGQDVLRSSLKTLWGIERLNALPTLRCSDAARMRLVGFKASQVRHGVCQRGAARRQGPRRTGPIGAEALADHLVELNLRALEALFNGVLRGLAKAGVLAAQVTGIVAGTALETTEPDAGWGPVTRQRKSADKRGHVHTIEGTVDGWKRVVLIEARTTIPLAAQVVPIQEHATLSLRALVTQARPNRAGYAPLHNVVVARGLGEGVDRWWLQQPGSLLVVPAKRHLAVTLEAPAPAAAGAGSTRGRRVHTVRQGQGTTAWRARRETEVVGIAALPPDDQSGTPEHGCHHNRRDFQPNPLNAVVVRTWHGRDVGPGGKPVFLTKAPVEKP